MDQIDEFEMKPLTAGLGFHKRQVSLKEHIAKSGVTNRTLRQNLPAQPPQEMTGGEKSQSRSAQEIIAELHEALKPVPNVPVSAASAVSVKRAEVQFTEILPREIGDVKGPARNQPEISPIENIDFQIPDKNLAPKLGSRRGASDNLVNPLTPVSVSFPAIILDGLIVFAFSLVFLASLIMATGIDLLSVFRSSQTDFATQLSLMALYVAIYEMYIIVSRSFFGSTLAEWTFDLRMGDEAQFQKASYPFKVFWRSILVVMTGIVVLPLASLIVGQDIAARLTGLQLYRRND